MVLTKVGHAAEQPLPSRQWAEIVIVVAAKRLGLHVYDARRPRCVDSLFQLLSWPGPNRESGHQPRLPACTAFLTLTAAAEIEQTGFYLTIIQYGCAVKNIVSLAYQS